MTVDDPRDATKDIAGAAEKAATSTADAVRDATPGAVDSVRGGVARGARAATEAYERTRDAAAGLRDNMPDTASDALDAGRRAYDRGSERLGRQVSRQPIEALLLAGAIGYLVGWAANRS